MPIKQPSTAKQQERRDRRIGGSPSARPAPRKAGLQAEQDPPDEGSQRPVARRDGGGRCGAPQLRAIINSIANITPADRRGVEGRAAMPAPAPAATRVMRCHGNIGHELAERGAE